MAEPTITFEVRALAANENGEVPSLGEFTTLEEADAVLAQANAEEELYVISEKHTHPAAE